MDINEAILILRNVKNNKISIQDKCIAYITLVENNYLDCIKRDEIIDISDYIISKLKEV